MDFRPSKIGKYLLLERLAMGGMAEVYRAKASGAGGFEKQLAIKRILPHYSQNEEFRRMFEYEARLSSMLTHANIVQVYDFVKSADTYLLALEYVDGKNLRQLINKAKKLQVLLTPEVGLFIINEVCKGLEYAHRKKDDITGRPLNIIHRDMSPQNVMIGYEGSVKIVDFGIAKAKDRVSETRAGVIKGKFGYMSPEQANGEVVDHRTDIFSTCIILYELLTNRRLFVSENDLSTLKMIQECVIPPPSRFNPKISVELEKIVLKGLSKDLTLRFQTAGELQKALQDVLNRNFPSYSSQELNDVMQKIFNEEIEQEKKRLEQLHRQSIPFSQQNPEVDESTFSGIPQVKSPEEAEEGITTSEDFEEKETLVTISEFIPQKPAPEKEDKHTEQLSRASENKERGKEPSLGGLEISFLNSSSPSTVPNTNEKKSQGPDDSATIASTQVHNHNSSKNSESTIVGTLSSSKDKSSSLKIEDSRSISKNSQAPASSGFKDLNGGSISGMSLDLDPAPKPKVISQKQKKTTYEPSPPSLEEEEPQTKSLTFTFFSIAIFVSGLFYGTYFLFKSYLNGNSKKAMTAWLPNPRNPSSKSDPATNQGFEDGKRITGNCSYKVESDPPSALVFVDDVEKGSTPMTLLLDCQKNFVITLKKAGYFPLSQTVFTKSESEKIFKALRKMALGSVRLRLTQNAIVEVTEMEFHREVKANEEFSVPLKASTKMKIHFKNAVLGIDTYEEFIVPEGQAISKTIILEGK